MLYINLNTAELTVIIALYFQVYNRRQSELQWSKIHLLLPPTFPLSFSCLPLLLLVFPPLPPPPPDQSPFPPHDLLLLPTNSDPLQQHRGGQKVLSLWIKIFLDISKFQGRPTFLSGNAIMISLIIFSVDIGFTDSDDSVLTDKSHLIVSPGILWAAI